MIILPGDSWANFLNACRKCSCVGYAPYGVLSALGATPCIGGRPRGLFVHACVGVDLNHASRTSSACCVMGTPATLSACCRQFVGHCIIRASFRVQYLAA